MDKKITSIVAYGGILLGALGIGPGLIKALGIFLPLVVWLVAYFVGDKNGAKVHLNQSLVLIIVGLIGSVIGFIPLIGTIVTTIIWIVTLVFGILGIVSAVKGDDKKLPFISDITIIK